MLGFGCCFYSDFHFDSDSDFGFDFGSCLTTGSEAWLVV